MFTSKYVYVTLKRPVKVNLMKFLKLFQIGFLFQGFTSEVAVNNICWALKLDQKKNLLNFDVFSNGRRRRGRFFFRILISIIYKYHPILYINSLNEVLRLKYSIDEVFRAVVAITITIGIAIAIE